VPSYVATAGLCGFMCGDCSVMWSHVRCLVCYVASCVVTAGLYGLMCVDWCVMWLHVR
jgi:hypothetical protein